MENNRLRFKCKIDPEEKADNVRYEIDWFQGRAPAKIIKSDVLTANLTEAYLQNNNGSSGEQLVNLGQEVSVFEINFLNLSWEIKAINRFYHDKIAVIDVKNLKCGITHILLVLLQNPLSIVLKLGGYI